MKNKFLRSLFSMVLAFLLAFSFLPPVDRDAPRGVNAAAAGGGGADAEAEAAVLELLNSISADYKNTAVDWEAMDMAAFGKAGDVAGAEIVRRARDTYTNGSLTDLARTVVALTALGVDAGRVYGGNEGVYLNFIGKLGEGDISRSQIMEAAFALIALDSGAYGDAGLSFTRQTCIDRMLELKLTPAAGQSGWAYSGDAPGIDVTAMVVAALAPYRGVSAAVAAAVDGALLYIAGQQNDSGHFGDSNATSMVVVALAALGIDPGAHGGNFDKNGNSPLDGLLSFRTVNNKFGYNDNSAPNSFSTEQGFRALVAYTGYMNSADNKYSIYVFNPLTGDGTELTGESDPGAVADDTSAVKNATVRIENLCNATELIPPTTVKAAGSHLDALKAALAANGKNPDSDINVDSSSGYAYIVSILGLGGDDVSKGWMYAINDDSPNESISESSIADGDIIVLYYMDWNDTVYLTKFDATSANITVGGAVTLTLTGADTFGFFGGGAQYAPISGANVYVRGVSGNPAWASAVTDADGKVTLSFPDAGTYAVSAKREGAFNETDLVPPLCTVTVASSSGPGQGPGQGPGSGQGPVAPGGYITVHFALQGINKDSGAEETWINDKILNNIETGSTVADVIVKAFEDSGYSQSGAGGGYVKSVTTPGGFTLSEMYDGKPNAGWLFKVNSTLPQVGMDAYTVTNGDQVLLYYTMDFTTDPDAGRFTSDSGSTGGNADSGSSDGGGTAAGASSDSPVITVEADVKDGAVAVAIGGEDIRKALKTVMDSAKNDGGDEMGRELKITVSHKTGAVSVEIEINAADVAVIAAEKDVKLTIESGLAAISMDTVTLASIVKAAGDGAALKFVYGADNKIFSEAGSIQYELKIYADGAEISAYNGKISVFLPASRAARAYPDLYGVYYIGRYGEYSLVQNAVFDPARGGYTFAVDVLGLFAVRLIAAVEAPDWDNPFNDVRLDDWYYEHVKYIYENRLMFGTGDGAFSPDAAMTRAMFVTMLYRLEGEPATTAANPFTDVGEGQWYTNAVLWAYETGVSEGYGDGVFGVDDGITREQLITMLYNYTDPTPDIVYEAASPTDILIVDSRPAYPDQDSISEWALNAMIRAMRYGWVQGDEEHRLAPSKIATRAEVAVIFSRYLGSNGE